MSISDQGPSRTVETSTRSHSRALVVLGLVALLSFLPGMWSLPPIDRDEPRFAQATKQMVESGNYLDIRFQDQPRLNKPPGIYWLQAGAVHAGHAAGVHQPLTTIWLYRLPSLLGAVGAVWLTYWTGLALVSRRAAFLAALLMASSVLLGIEARLAKTDAVLLAATVAALGSLARLYLSRHGRPPASHASLLCGFFWTAVAAGLLVKGPVIVMVVGLCALTLSVLDRSIRWLADLRPVAGLLLCAVVVAPWLLAAGALSDGRVIDGLAADVVPRILHSVEGHGAPPGYYVVLFWVTFWPGSALAGVAVPGLLASRSAPAMRFLLAWLVPSWVVCELMVTKLPHYVLPLYPALAILVATVVDSGPLVPRRWLTRGAMWIAVVPLVTGAGAVAATWILSGADHIPPMAAVLILGAAALGAVAWRQVVSGRAESAVLLATAGALMLSTAVYGLILPRLPLFPSRSLAAVMTTQDCAAPAAVTSFAYQEPSLVFLAGTPTRAVNVTDAVGFLAEGPCRFAFIDEPDSNRFVEAAAARRLAYVALPPVTGINISKGASVSFTVYRSGGG